MDDSGLAPESDPFGGYEEGEAIPDPFAGPVIEADSYVGLVMGRPS